VEYLRALLSGERKTVTQCWFFALSMNADGNQPILHRSPLRTDKTDPTVVYLLNLMKARSILLLACLLGATPSLFAQDVSITVAPPPLVAYEQPPCPAEGYFWSPGYWAYGEDGYFWVPGTWVEVPQPGYFWTPGYWAFASGYYIWHGGYWGPHVGYYGGINYGYGYYGSGFYGGRWDGNVFRYNTAVWHVNSAVIHNTYVDRTVINHETGNRHVSFNGPGGIETRPTAAEEAAAQNRRLEATPAQRAHEQEARNDRNQHYSVNHGRPNTVVRTNAAGQPAAVHHEGAQPEAVHHQGGQPKAVHHEGVRPEAAHHEATHPESAHREVSHPETTHHEAVHTQATHHEVAHPQATHHVSAPPAHHQAAHPAPHHPPAHSQPKKKG
jgi:WXXGXW repeat (2 copies)